ncbi:MAG: hypothetical protein HYU53_12465 [Acidobacteria bacterium]|nr:hypothetical protein [Acidobacteriota bacterium]
MTVDDAVTAAASAPSWDARVAAIRQILEQFGVAAHVDVYAAIARRIYVPSLAPDFAYVHWREEYELAGVQDAFDKARALTRGFVDVDRANLARVLLQEPATLRIFRVILGFTAQEFAAATTQLAATDTSVTAVAAISASRVKSIEAGGRINANIADACARVIDLTMRRQLFGASPTEGVRLKLDKPDTLAGWDTIRQYAASGVPLPVFLHQRLYGGAFRQLLDATSGKRGDILEDAVAELFQQNGVPSVRTGSQNQEEIARRFNITVRPAPDFVVFDRTDALKGMLECKAANDGGTARDKAARFRALRTEATRLGGIPLFAVLAGLGWTRTTDALGPVIRDTDGRTFTIPTLNEMLRVQPFPPLVGTA